MDRGAGGLQSMGSQRVGLDQVTNIFTSHMRRKRERKTYTEQEDLDQGGEEGCVLPEAAT